MKSTETIRNFLFLALGLTRVYQSQNPDRLPLMEPDGVRTCRRNIIALAGLLVLAGLAGAGPGDLDVFGVKPGEGTRGVIVIGAAAFGVQFYWYCLKYCHLKEDGKVLFRDMEQSETQMPLDAVTHLGIAQKTANLISNWIAFLLTVFSLYFIVCWIVSAHAKGVAT